LGLFSWMNMNFRTCGTLLEPLKLLRNNNPVIVARLVLHNISTYCSLNWVLVHSGGVDIALVATCRRQI
jgi:hypothetical protein